MPCKAYINIKLAPRGFRGKEWKMGQHTDATIAANEDNAAKHGTVVAAAPGFYLLDERHPESRHPILAWRIGDADCNCVLPVTCTGTHSSQCYVLRPDGSVEYNAMQYGGAVPGYADVGEWEREMKRVQEFGGPIAHPIF
jgi:hypothetical protein